jgi:uncharacterized membrane protein
MAAYRDRVAKDLERWIGAGLVAEGARDPILATIPETRRLDAAAALAWVGAVLLGLAVIAFISANWDALPRIARFALVLGVFAAGAGAAAWCSEHKRPNTANGLLTFAALGFAAAIGLTGQIFDIAGNARAALYASGVVAAALGLTGRGSGPLIAALVFFGMGDYWVDSSIGRSDTFLMAVPWLAIAAPAAGALAVRWRSAPLAHAASLGAIAAALWIALKVDHHAVALLAGALALFALAAGGRWLAQREVSPGGVFYGWFAWGALGLFAVAGYDYGAHTLDLVHRIAWLAIASGGIAIGRHDRNRAVTAAGVIGLLSAVTAILVDLGVNLLTAAAVFFAAALVAVGAGLALRRMNR